MKDRLFDDVDYDDCDGLLETARRAVTAFAKNVAGLVE